MANTITIKAKTRQEIADLLGISTDTLRRRIKENGIVLPHGLVSPQQQKLVFDALWYPAAHPKEAYASFG
jgi:DNA invertase Pin-like site-specific DNA recombinase